MAYDWLAAVLPANEKPEENDNKVLCRRILISGSQRKKNFPLEMVASGQTFFFNLTFGRFSLMLLVNRKSNGPLARYVKLRVAHAPGMPGTFSCHQLQRKPLVSDPGMHHGTCVTHVPWCMSGSLTLIGLESVPGIPDACATRNFTYLARSPWNYCCPLIAILS